VTGAFQLDATAGASGQALVSAGGSNTPTWSTLGTMAAQNSTTVAITGGTITGITDLTVADGGTGASTITANSVILGNGASTLSGNLVAPSTSGNVLTSNGTTWSSTAPNISQSSFTGSNQSLATDGYQKLPGGLIMQWGTTPVIAGPGTLAITFGIAFPTNCANVQITIKDESTDTSSTGIFAARSVTTAGFTLRNGEDPNMIFNWLAIGY
jgi:hypothetical protein